MKTEWIFRNPDNVAICEPGKPVSICITDAVSHDGTLYIVVTHEKPNDKD